MRVVGIVLELPTQRSDVSRDGVGADHGVGEPERDRKIAVSDYHAGTRDERVQEDVLVWGQTHLARPDTNLTTERIDLKVGDRQRRNAMMRLASIA